MATLNERNTSAGSSSGSPIRKKARGSTKLRLLIARHQDQREKVHVDFDVDLNPIGPEEDRFISYVGY